MQSKKIEQCHLCSKVTELTYEHVPPQGAFNKHKVFIHLGRDIVGRDKFPWDVSGVKAEQHQKGIGWHTLCGKCNNDTGSWYGNAFVDFIYKGYKEVSGQSQFRNRQWLTLNLTDIYPLRIIKQIIAMFCSINSPNFAVVHPDLQTLVLNKTKKGISGKGFGIYLYLLKGKIARYIGIAGILNFNNNEQRILSELSTPPFGCVLEINPKDKKEYCDITFFANQFNYMDKKSISINIPVYESNTHFPADYRTKQEVMNDYIQNRLSRFKNK